MVFIVAVNEPVGVPVTVKENDLLKSELTVKGNILKLYSSYIPVEFDRAMEKTKTEGRE